ncbi:probable 1-deoxy-D-xylulose-5-phosphate synthase, chloroplastic [Zingiber officinale]|uniref:probable 1-deoxy-D-xylulose-5-phosphate synthase, chloroplastic n=1 Tax=Zingiber officinale TaxID=94328 RepID=UPI001C4ACA16|nr:probable 1-deoxy-D-xylulose-5-phosphate synthase, chloroplastic [Zingiber officinale]
MKSSLRTFNDVLVETLVAEAERDKSIVVVHTGIAVDPSLKLFQSRFPDRIFDIGMAEQHAITFSARLSCGGMKPFCIIPSTFLQRGYDQVIFFSCLQWLPPHTGLALSKPIKIASAACTHMIIKNCTTTGFFKVIEDVDLQKVPVRFAISNAGLVGSEGPTQSGIIDITFMACLPNIIVMAPSDEDELIDMVATAVRINDRPISFQYPRIALLGNGSSLHNGIPIEIGKGEILVEGKHMALLGYGVMVQNCLKVRSLLASLGIEDHEFLMTVEEGTVAALVLMFLNSWLLMACLMEE